MSFTVQQDVFSDHIISVMADHPTPLFFDMSPAGSGKTYTALLVAKKT